MKKLCALWIALLCAATSHAQLWDNSKPDRLLTFGIRAGVNVTGLTKSDYPYFDDYFDDYYVIYSLKPKISPYVGVNVDINIVKSFAVETGLFYTQFNFEEYWYSPYDGSSYDNGHHENCTNSFLQIPVAALFKFPVSSDFYLSAKLGGYLGVSVGDSRTILSITNPTAGIVTGIGAGYKKWSLNVQPQFCLTEGTSVFFNSEKGKFRNVIVTVGYDF